MPSTNQHHPTNHVNSNLSQLSQHHQNLRGAVCRCDLTRATAIIHSLLQQQQQQQLSSNNPVEISIASANPGQRTKRNQLQLQTTTLPRRFSEKYSPYPARLNIIINNIKGSVNNNDSNAEEESSDDLDLPLLHSAAKNLDIPMLNLLLLSIPHLRSLPDASATSSNLFNLIEPRFQWTPLHTTADSDDDGDVARFLINNFASNSNNAWLRVDVNAQSIYGDTALHIACERGNYGMVECLVNELNADVTLRNESGETCLLVATRTACEQYQHSSTSSLVDDTDDVSGGSGGGGGGDSTIIQHNSLGGVEIVKLLLLSSSPSQVDTPDADGTTPLIVAITNGHLTLVKLLLEVGKARLDLPDSDGFFPLDHAQVVDDGAGRYRDDIIHLLRLHEPIKMQRTA